MLKIHMHFCKQVHHSSSSFVFCLNMKLNKVANYFKINSTAWSPSFHNRIADTSWHRAVFLVFLHTCTLQLQVYCFRLEKSLNLP
ncbi:hypothetical protein XELAEV_18039034mg [Xenopus laevis]|uniref:Uncharacterized protein n=1 Tax=Xenopus laevis TaxID=8355 RepID=A0A974C7Y5_XENLA|nr:hypothetical protein XELAEV_18039034mg [Xenopus laevis]